MNWWLVIYILIGVHFLLSAIFAIYIYHFYFRNNLQLIINLLFGSIGFIKSLIEYLKKERRSFY